MATIKEIAKACDVSVATVSNILNRKPGASEKTKEKVLKVVDEMGYTPNIVAKNLKMQKTRSIGVIVEDMTIFSIPNIVDGITEHCEEIDYQILLTNLRLYQKYNDVYYHRDDYYRIVKDEIYKLMAKQVEGIIYVAAHERVIKCIPENLTIPAVMVYGYSDSDRIPSVVVDDTHGAYRAVCHLLENGHRKIALIMGKADSIHAQSRLKGYQKALFDHEVLYDPDQVYHGDWTRESAYRYVDQILKSNCSAVFCMNDLMAGGIYDRLEELGMEVGKDISVVGYDNRELSNYYKPPLTTVNLPLHDIGYRASDLMNEMLCGQVLREDEMVCAVECQELIRKSVRNINK